MKGETISKGISDFFSIRKFRNNSKEENTIDFFAKLLEQKDKRIRELTGQLEEESKASNKNQDDLVLLKSKLEGLTGMCYGKKSP